MATQSSDDDDSNAPPPMKRPRQSDASSAAGSLDGFSGPSKSMMKKMGYISGEGLGRERQGITEPVQAVTIKGRSGLGFESVSATSRPEFQWREGDDPVVVRRQVDWLTGGRDAPSVINNAEEMKLRWMSVGLAKMTLDDETGFVSPEVLTGVLECKTFLDSMSNKDLMDSRSRSNPYETVKNAIFMNRAAVKMAEVDAVLQFRMSQPFDSDEIFQFADICAGPGGFTEYLLWRNRAQDGRGPRAKGFGLTLRGECDFRLNDMLMGAPEFFYPYYGPTDQSHGDIYLEDNMLGFRDLIMANTANLGVHLVTADGGFSVEGQENIQEIRSKQLYLCQALTAMLVLRSGGSFLCKLFDIFTEFSAGLMYLLYLAFDQFALFKPATSRPANSERYVICRGYRKQQSESIVQYLLLVNAEINLLKVEAVHLPQSERQDVQGLVSLDVLKADRAFSDYLTESNDTLGRMQIVGLSKIHHFYDNPGMKDTRQEDTRTECLQFWGIPDEKRGEKVLGKENPTVLISQLIGEGNMSKLLPPDASSSAKSVTADSLEKNPDFSPYEQRAIACGEVNKEVMLLYSRGNGSVLVYKPAEREAWTAPDSKSAAQRAPIPRETLLLALSVSQLKPPSYKLRVACLQILDCPILQGQNLTDKPLSDRLACIRQLCYCANFERVPLRSRLQPPVIFPVYELPSDSADSFKKLVQVQKIKGSVKPMPMLKQEDGYLFAIKGLYLFRVTRDPWRLTMSQKANKLYYFHKEGKALTCFESRPEFLPNYRQQVESMMWVDYESANDKELDVKRLLQLVDKKLNSKRN
ncbi:hypothetical protein BOX15_Mlig024465g1 [Macrostomum lignano]|uniref:Cap-specific mRNA (nucleoside-2'-O-)-methyltransferase 1 n=2 Tax=Macrostomum lignano TaxID=282301 RepID=A0A267FQN4_9PLAT|nr:hypothetical protein BOX15_Mlig024465g1 [Macrostomum lignano]